MGVGGTGRLGGLDTLRGIAALCIVAFHALMLVTQDFGIGKAYLAVDFFFVLSGYLMARTYEHRFAAGMGLRAFMRVRLARLYPFMLAGGLIGVLFLRQVMPDHWMQAAAFNLLLLPVLFGHLAFPLNVASWSIFFELLANALHPLALARMRKGALIALLALLGAMLVKLAMTRDIDVGGSPDTLLAAVPRVLFSYILGILLWRQWGDAPPVRLPAWATFAAMPAFFVGVWAAGVTGGWADLIFVFVVSPVLLIGGLSARGGRVGAAMGALSFPLYAVQMPVLELSHRAGWPMAACVAMCVAVAGVLAAVPMLARRVRQGAGGGVAAAERYSLSRCD